MINVVTLSQCVLFLAYQQQYMVLQQSIIFIDFKVDSNEKLSTT